MKSKSSPAKVDWASLYSILIAKWRQLQKLPIGPLDRLQTREFRSVVEEVLKLSSNFDRDDKNQVGAYILYQWPQHMSEGISLLQEVPEPFQKVLEIGPGSSPFSFAASLHGALDVCSIEPYPLTAKLAGEINGRMGYPLSVREQDPKQLRTPHVEEKWDLIIVAYTLFRMFDSIEEQKRYLSSLCGKLSDTGYLLLVESSDMETNRRFLTLRDVLISHGIKIQAPCIWQGNCPALAHGSSPCFTQRPFEKPPLIHEIQRSARINSNSLKMSYLLMRNQQQALSHPDGALYRVVSPPIDTFKGKRHFLCGVDGKKTLGTRLKEHPKQSRAYDYLKKGDVVSIENALKAGEDLIITEDTTFTLKAPFDKPLK